MSWAVSIRPAAEADLKGARDWYERQRAGLGDEFLLCVADVLTGLEESADRTPVYYQDFRRVLTERFPYKIFFRIEGDVIVVFRILHAARDHARQLNDSK